MEFVNATQAAELIGVSGQTVINWIIQGRIDGARRIGRIWLIPVDSLDKIDVPRMGRPPKDDNDNGQEE